MRKLFSILLFIVIAAAPVEAQDQDASEEDQSTDMSEGAELLEEGAEAERLVVEGVDEPAHRLDGAARALSVRGEAPRRRVG